MSDLHSVGVSQDGSVRSLEEVDPRFLAQGMEKARTQTIEVLTVIKNQLKIGMTEDEARKLALEIFQDFGVKKHWHRPYIRFGSGTALSFRDPIQNDYRLRENDPFYIDLGPVWTDTDSGLEYEGDYGDSFVKGTFPAAEHCANTARLLFSQAQDKWRESKLTGVEIYKFLKQSAVDAGYVLLETVDGHRLGDFPHQHYSKHRLAAVEIVPSSSRWVLEVQIVDTDRRFGAFFEDLL